MANKYCPLCERSLPSTSFIESDVACDACHTQVTREETKLRDVSSIATAARQISRALVEAKSKRQEADIPAIADALRDKLGGPEGIAQMLSEDMDRVRGVNLTDAERVGWVPKEQTIQKYHKLVSDLFASKDQFVAAQEDLGGLETDDLKAILYDIAQEIVDKDEDLRKQIAIDVLQQDPDFFRQALKDAGVTVVDVEPLTNEDQP